MFSVSFMADFLQSLAKTLLSLETPTRGKYILLTLLAQHVPVSAILDTSPDLPQELLRAMGHQVLACHVSLIMDSVSSIWYCKLLLQIVGAINFQACIFS